MEEQQFSDSYNKQKIRPFSKSAEVVCRGYSRPFQRVLCDFGIDHSFAEASKKILEHYDVEVSPSTIRRITETHAKNATVAIARFDDDRNRPKEQVIAETDGCFIQIVETGKDMEDHRGDCRKKRSLGYREARLSLAHEQGSKDIRYAGTFQSVKVAGEQLADCVRQIGCDQYTKVHCVGDGAKWIANQVEEHFGANGTYLIDFFHLCEYLYAAAPSCAENKEKAWMSQQKRRLKAGEIMAVLSDLRKHVELRETVDEEAPVRKCKRYIENRLEQLGYKQAIEKNLPIGSGEIESAHRYVIQKRLKLAGAAWKFENADNMLDLRVLRANNKWGDYWKKLAA